MYKRQADSIVPFDISSAVLATSPIAKATSLLISDILIDESDTSIIEDCTFPIKSDILYCIILKLFASSSSSSPVDKDISSEKSPSEALLTPSLIIFIDLPILLEYILPNVVTITQTTIIVIIIVVINFFIFSVKSVLGTSSITFHPDVYKRQDRYGEVYTTLSKILEGVEKVPLSKLVLNGDDSLFGKLPVPNETIYYGFNVGVKKDNTIDVNADAKFCKICKAPYQYNFITYNHLGDFYCSECGYKRADLKYSVNEILELNPNSSKVLINNDEITISQSRCV